MCVLNQLAATLSLPTSLRLSRLRPARKGRCGFSLTWLPVALVVTGIVVAAVAYPVMKRNSSDVVQRPLTHTVARGVFTHNITEPGELESSSNVEILCEVKGRNSTGTMILEIVPEGTVVAPGDFLVRFDSSALDAERIQQQIVCNNSQATMIQSKNVYETSLIALEEYIEGTFKQEEQTIQSEVFVAEEDLRRAKEYLQHSQRLAARGFTTALQVEADRFAVDKAAKALETAHTKLKVLQDFTRAKMIKQLEADVQTSKAKMAADESSYELDLDKLKEIDEQIAKCTVNAPAAGKVVYANETDGRGNNEIVIEEGAMVRERQVVIRLPDMGRMQVMAKIDESRIGYISTGLPARIRLDAAPAVQLRGEVTRVNEYPLPRGWMSSSVKQYGTYIEIFDLHPSMRPGMTAQVTIQVDEIPNSLTLPVQTVFERGGNRYCIVYKNEQLELRKIGKGPTNHSFVLIPETDLMGDEQTVVEGELVVMNPTAYLDRFDLPSAATGKDKGRPGEPGGAGPNHPGANGETPNDAGSQPAGPPQGEPQSSAPVQPQAARPAAETLPAPRGDAANSPAPSTGFAPNQSSVSGATVSIVPVAEGPIAIEPVTLPAASSGPMFGVGGNR